jgi:hypothetical protein
MPSNSTVISNGILVPQSGDTVTCAGQQFRTSVKNSTAQNVTVNVATGNNDYLTTPLSPAIDLGPGTRSIMAA